MQTPNYNRCHLFDASPALSLLNALRSEIYWSTTPQQFVMDASQKHSNSNDSGIGKMSSLTSDLFLPLYDRGRTKEYVPKFHSNPQLCRLPVNNISSSAHFQHPSNFKLSDQKLMTSMVQLEVQFADYAISSTNSCSSSKRLLRAYHVAAARLELGRIKMLRSSGGDEAITQHLTTHYDHLHRQLIQMILTRLRHLTENSDSTTATSQQSAT